MSLAIGQRFGSRVVVGQTDERDACGSVVWRWRCDCGAAGQTTAGVLRRGRTCTACAHPPLDITGQRFVRLVAVRRFIDRWGNSAWECICDCGRKRSVALSSLHVADPKKRAVSCGRCKIKCTSCGKRTRKSIRTADDPTTCSRCVLLAGHRRRQVEVRGRVCRWCARTDSQTRFATVHECSACNRQACRNGRDAEGRPIARGPRKVVAS